jgi:DNA mismatch repair protein MutS2
MRDDLDRGFKDAHARIAAVIRDLQRGGTARDAAHAREHLAQIADETRRTEEKSGLSPRADEALDPIDWRTAKPGDPVRVAGSGNGVLRALPDRRGRVALSFGSARVTVPMERVGRAPAAPKTPRPQPAVSVTNADREPGGEAGRCDLRGKRVDEAIDDLLAALDRAAGAGRARLVVVHGLGTGALRKAVREHLADSAYVARFEGAPPDEGGDGATIAHLA